VRDLKVALLLKQAVVFQVPLPVDHRYTDAVYLAVGCLWSVNLTKALATDRRGTDTSQT